MDINAGKMYLPPYYLYNEKVKHLIRKGNEITWRPLSRYCDMIWMRRITEPYTWPRGYWVKAFNIDYVTVTLALEGDMILTSGGKEYMVKAGEGVVTPCGNRITATGPSGRFRSIYFIPAGLMFSNMMTTLQFDKITVIREFVSEQFMDIYARICELHKRQDPATIPELSALTYEMIMYTATKIGKSEYPQPLASCLEFIDNNISRKLTLDLICRETGVGKTRLKELFAAYLHSSPGRHITELRLKNALNLLENESFPIKRVADMCGFENPLYFSNAFKARYGKSPRNYLKAKMMQPE